MKNPNKNLLVLTAVIPFDPSAGLYSLVKGLSSKGYHCDLYSAAKTSPELYKSKDLFEKSMLNVEKSVFEKDYGAVIFNGLDSVPVFHDFIRSMKNHKVILFGSAECEHEWNFDLVSDSPEEIYNYMGSAPENGSCLTSIVMLTFNQLDLTKQTLQSLEQHTRVPYELLIVDNGSDDGTIDFLREYSESKKNVKCIFNEENLGFAKANNQGISISKGDYVLLLNNDVILTENWLVKMIRCADSFKKAGVVGPCTNMASGPQKTIKGYESLDDLPKFSNLFAIKNAGRWVDCHRLNAFCFLIKREVIESVGLLDENFGPGGYEDYDYCLRVRQAGYRIMLAGDTYVHHIGGQGYEPNKLDYNELRVVNKQIFINKWCRRALEIMEIIPDG